MASDYRPSLQPHEIEAELRSALAAGSLTGAEISAILADVPAPQPSVTIEVRNGVVARVHIWKPPLFEGEVVVHVRDYDIEGTDEGEQFEDETGDRFIVGGFERFHGSGPTCEPVEPV
jgi:hypothetical protein